MQENAQAKLLSTSTMLCKQCFFFKKSSQEFFAKSAFLNLDLQKTRIFLKTHTKRLMLHYQTFYSVQLAFFVLGPSFVVGGVSKNSYVL